ncbi:MAG TPA: tRNA pseudouridine(13) synthase TruD [Acidimicrobiales bacterium]|nr:tRNA pseudouridine(13) synthase TruD [Acidimicrobiales bacterium]
MRSACGPGAPRVFRLRKRGYTTFAAITKLAERMGVDALAVGYSYEPIRIGELHGNIFSVVVRDLDRETAREVLALCRTDHYFANYYDTQRFGTSTGPKTTHLMGEALLEGRFDDAFVLLRDSRTPGAEGALNWDDTAAAFLVALTSGRSRSTSALTKAPYVTGISGHSPQKYSARRLRCPSKATGTSCRSTAVAHCGSLPSYGHFRTSRR